jgi:serine/threonine protein kinase
MTQKISPDFPPAKPRQIAVGEGSTVFSSTYKSSPVAVKVASTAATITQAKNELALLSSIPPHTNIISILSAFDSPDGGFNLVYPLFDTDLYTLLKRRALTPPEQKNIIRQIGRALAHLHAHAIVHRDVKIENVLLKHGRVVLADLGLGHRVDQGPAGKRGSVEYLSPECFIHAGDASALDFRKVWLFLRFMEKKVDCFAFGVVVYCILTREMPFHGASRKAMWTSICLGRWTRPGGESERRMLEGLLDVSPARRSSVNDVLGSDWLRSAE